MTVSSLRIGIETEFLLRALDMENQCKGTIEEFAEGLVQYYNTKIAKTAGQIPLRFESDHWHASDNSENLGCWSVVVEASIDPDSDDCKHSMILSPSHAVLIDARGPRIRISHHPLRKGKLMAPEHPFTFPNPRELR